MKLGIMIPKIFGILLINMKQKKFRVNLHFFGFLLKIACGTVNYAPIFLEKRSFCAETAASVLNLTKKVGGAIVVAV